MEKPYEGTLPYLFVSYSHKDTPQVLAAVEFLQSRGFRVWYDAGIEGGTEWPEYIAAHLTDCAAVLSFVSPHFAESDNCRRELTFALNQKKPVLSAFLSNFELSGGLNLQLGLAQALYLENCESLRQFWESLAAARIFDSCRDTQPATPAKAEPAPLAEQQARARTLVSLLQTNGSWAIGLRTDGSACCTGLFPGRQKLSNWTDLIAVSAGRDHAVGLRSNGTVISIGGKSNAAVSGWQDIVAVCAGFRHTVGLRGDGTAVAAYWGDPRHYVGQCEVDRWSNITAISSSHNHTVGLRADGTVVATGSNSNGQCQVDSWKNIVAISAGHLHTVGLRADGTVVATVFQGADNCGQCRVQTWQDMVAISAGRNHTVGLKADGTVIATEFLSWYDPWTGTGCTHEGQCQLDTWQDIVAISAGTYNTLGLRADGTLATTNHAYFPREELSQWRLFESIEKRETERLCKTRRRNQGLCLHCGGNFTGLFSKKCAACGKLKDY